MLACFKLLRKKKRSSIYIPQQSSRQQVNELRCSIIKQSKHPTQPNFWSKQSNEMLKQSKQIKALQRENEWIWSKASKNMVKKMRWTERRSNAPHYYWLIQRTEKKLRRSRPGDEKKNRLREVGSKLLSKFDSSSRFTTQRLRQAN